MELRSASTVDTQRFAFALFARSAQIDALQALADCCARYSLMSTPPNAPLRPMFFFQTVSTTALGYLTFDFAYTQLQK